MKSKRSSKLAGAVIRYLLLALGTVIFALPTVYMISLSLRPNKTALNEWPPRILPDMSTVTLDNFRYVLDHKVFYTNFLNSVYVSISTVILAALVASALAFVIGRFKSKATKMLFGFIIITMIIPGTTMIIPQFALANGLGLKNTVWGLIPFYVAWVIPFSTFMIKGFMENIPDEIVEAAWIDGASVFGVFNRIALPLASPAIASVSIFNFLTAWEEYPWAAQVLKKSEWLRTMPVAIAGFNNQYGNIDWGYMLALSVLCMIPVVTIFIICQKFFVQGLTAGGVKG